MPSVPSGSAVCVRSGPASGDSAPGGRSTLPPMARLVRACAVLGTVLTLGAGLQGCGADDRSDGAVADASSATATADLLAEALDENAKGNSAAARKKFQELLRQDPANKLAAYNLGVLAQQAGDLREARSKYELTLNLDPAYEPALYNFAILTNQEGDAKGAVALYERAIKADPRDANAHYNLGLLLRRLGDEQRSELAIGEALKLDPSLKPPAPLATTPSG